jgi:hypothetical protein
LYLTHKFSRYGSFERAAAMADQLLHENGDPDNAAANGTNAR